MSEQEQDRPLTRRELREREQRAATEAAAETSSQEPAEADESAYGDIEIPAISPYNEDGSLRSRRELRELEAAAMADAVAERRSAAPPIEPVEIEEASDDYDAYSAPTEPYSVEDLREAEASREATGFDHSDTPTEAFSLEDILEAAEPTSPTGDADAVAALFAGEDDGGAEHDSEGDPTIDSSQPDPVDAEETGETVEIEEPASDAPAAEDQAQNVESAEREPSASEFETKPATYSFPDIQPPEEWRSVFDDPARAASVGGGDSSEDFDDLISRAVAHEGHTGRTGTSALILPSHPGDTGGLAGPLGMTGELYVTGSIELPKSIGETGGHAALHDSIDLAPFLTGEQPASIASASDAGPVPVSAMNAVSARRRPEIPVVAEPTKDRSKLPLILALSGGGLVVVVVGVAVYAATQGWFA